MRYRILSALLGLVLCGSGVAIAQSGFSDTFDGAPTAPQPYTAPVPGLAAWDVVVHSRDVNTWAQLEPMDAHHGPACEGPPATHHLTGSYGDAVFQCANHFMTSLNAAGYGAIYVTPPVVADWADTPAVIQWDMSTQRASGRDWVDVWVSPFDTNLILPLEDWLPDLQGPPKRAIHIRMDNTGPNSMFRTVVYPDNFVGAEVSTQNYIGYESVLTPSPARRDTFQLTISRTHLKFGMPAYNLWWMDGDIADLGWTGGIVQFGHHSYNPYKDCTPGPTCGPNTWHWDAVSVTPSLPFTITKAPQEYVSNLTPSNLVTFPSPSQAGDHLRFAGAGDQYQVSFDGGTTWQMAPVQPQMRNDFVKFQSYWMPVPVGTQQVRVRAQGGWWGQDWLARDFTLWGQVQAPPNQRTPTPTRVPATPTRTATPLPTNAPTQTPPPSSTPAPTPTDLPTPTTLPSVTPTSGTAPTATPTSPPRCGRIDTINGGQVYTPLPDSACFQQ